MTRWQLSICTILFLNIAMGCSTHIKINPRGCDTQSSYRTYSEDEWKYEDRFRSYNPYDIKESNRFVVKKTLRSPWGIYAQSEYLLKDLLEEKGIHCEEVGDLEITLKTGPLDAVASLFPLLAQQTVILEGHYNRTD